MEMYTTTMPQADPERFMNQFTSWEISSKANKWQGRNISRWQSKDYDDTFRAAERELDPVKRAALFIKMNDLAVGSNYIQPLVYRPRVTALNSKVKAYLSGWDNDMWQLANWYRET
jgi:peptide/nickel transport system substrate-binding protein